MKKFRYFSLTALLFSSLIFACNEESVNPLRGGGDEEEDDPIVVPPPPPPSSNNVTPIDSLLIV
ncbi:MULTISPECIES: hypothetical protein [Fulvivirga]|uniref:Uncharacterized protein n=1 Tax=Fulvivirga sediminis TaxID=2803949 RepID=A0A937F8X8_9BACT|nr:MULTISPECIES: hypothetical protein [Fulvivirga]MBL3657376.1 hypothetical protein [Fulvivirga sediminis]UII26108.1 hypothetical protein LVD15_22825 [Fulvivirga maritima]